MRSIFLSAGLAIVLMFQFHNTCYAINNESIIAQSKRVLKAAYSKIDISFVSEIGQRSALIIANHGTDFDALYYAEPQSQSPQLTEILRAKPMTLKCCFGYVFQYKDPTTSELQLRLYDPKLSALEPYLAHPLPHPNTEFLSNGGLTSFVFSPTKEGRFQYYTYNPATGFNPFLQTNPYEGQFLVGHRNQFYQICFDLNDDCTMTWLNLETQEFEPTNITNYSLSIVPLPSETLWYVAHINPNNPKEIWYVKHNAEGCQWIDFLVNRDSNKQRLEEWKATAKRQWHQMDLPFNECFLHIDTVQLDNNGVLTEARGSVCAKGNPEFIWSLTGLSIKTAHDSWAACLPYPQKEMLKVHDSVLGIDVIYYSIKPPQSNGRTLVFVFGGPHSYCESGDESVLQLFIDAGYTIILPQETLRTGYGWRHFQKGLGEMGRRNCTQILEIVEHAHRKGIISDLSHVHLGGHSYGGYQALAQATHMADFSKPEGMENFKFRSVFADAAFVPHEGWATTMLPYFLIPHDGDRTPEEWTQYFSPILYTPKVPLMVIHGRNDCRCPIQPISDFCARHSNIFFVEHDSGHEAPSSVYEQILAWVNSQADA